MKNEKSINDDLFDLDDRKKFTILSMIATKPDDKYLISIIMKDNNQQLYLTEPSDCSFYEEMNVYSKKEAMAWFEENTTKDSLIFISKENKTIECEPEKLHLTKDFLKQCEFQQIKSIVNCIHYLLNYEQGFVSVDSLSCNLLGVLDKSNDNEYDLSLLFKKNEQILELNVQCEIIPGLNKWNYLDLNLKHTTVEDVINCGFDGNVYITKNYENCQIDLDCIDRLAGGDYSIANVINFNDHYFDYNKNNLIKSDINLLTVMLTMDDKNIDSYINNIKLEKYPTIEIVNSKSLPEIQINQLEQINDTIKENIKIQQSNELGK